MALAADLNYEVDGLTELQRGVLTASLTYYKGGIVQQDKGTGLWKKATDVANEVPYGVLKRGYVAPASPAMACEIERGKIWLPFSGAAASSLGKPYYASDDGTLTATPGTNGGFAGYAVDWKTGFLLIDFRTGGQKGAIG